MSDIDISKLSYTKKDFASMYPEVLDLARQLTNKWDPSQSNESDPGVVLLKEGAFMVDHTNYNIDKNVLENFLPSATQDRSVRNICEMNGYTPRYYVAPEGYITFNYENDDDTTTNGHVIPAFTLVISDADNSISYTQVEELTLSGETNVQLSGVCKFIEGTINTLTVNDSATILLENLDDNNRLYLPETMIAQNGIFIKYVNDTNNYGYWERNNYLLTQPSGSRMYKIDYDSLKGLPYIEFPSDIASIIGDGLSIQYISTTGSSGNVSANTLNTIVSPSSCEHQEVDLIPNLTLNNVSAIVNGKDPETIDEMYKSFKKVIGTFETLVSCKDYSNYINMLEDGNNSPLISNCYVADRRTDYNKAQNVVTFDTDGTFLKNISIKDSKLHFYGVGSTLPSGVGKGTLFVHQESGVNTLKVYDGSSWNDATNINLNDFVILTEAMTPYDIAIYALKAFSIADWNSLLPYKAIENSFKPIDKVTLKEIQSDIEDAKCICHTYNDPDLTDDNKDVYCFKNYMPLTVTITPYNKVTSEQEAEILLNVYEHISEELNSSKIEFGEKIERETIKKVIVDSDERIKSVDISYDNYLKVMAGDGQEYDLSNTAHYEESSWNSTFILELISKNILAGRVCLFEFDNNFNLDFGQEQGETDKGPIFTNVKTVTTELPLVLDVASETNVQTANTTSTTATTTSDGTDDYMYCFNALNLVTDEGVRVNVQKGMTYTLQNKDDKVDTFIYRIKTSSGYSTVTLKASDDCTYKISFSGDVIKNSADRQVKYNIPTGTMTIETIQVDASAEDEGINIDYTLKQNECVQIIYPNYYSENTFGMYVNYRYQGTDTIRANEEHTLVGDEKLIFQYTKDSVSQTKILSAGSVVKSSFDLKPTDSITSSGTSKTWTDSNGITHSNDKFLTLSSNETISERIMMKTVLNSTNLMCYWIINSALDGSNKLFENGVKTKILGPDDYFIYANDTLDELFILGSGTLLERTDDDDTLWKIDSNDYTIKSISTNGTSANIPWQRINFSTNNFYITEMNVVTLGEGDILKITGWIGTTLGEYIGNDWKVCKGNIIYTCGSDDQVILPKVTESDFYRIKSRLDINCSITNPQQLLFTATAYDTSGNPTAANGIQKFTVTDTGGNSTEFVPFAENRTPKVINYKIQTSSEVSALGGDSVILDRLYSDQPNVYVYVDDVHKIIYDDYVSKTKLVEGGRTISVDYDTARLGTQKYSQEFPLWYDCKNESGSAKYDDYTGYIIPIYIENNQVPIKCSVYKKVTRTSGSEYIPSYSTPLTINFYNETSSATSLNLIGNSVNFIHINDTTYDDCVVYLVLEWEISPDSEGNIPLTDPEIIIVNDIKIVEGLNEKISVDTNNITLENVLKTIDKILTNSDQNSIKYYYTYEPDDAMKINLDKYMHLNVVQTAKLGYNVYDEKAFDNVDVMWDKNNIANMLTIQQIDLRNSNMSVDEDMIGE